ncbi:hypothetical protein ACW2QC_18910 [Virgibacillus sp. FSP13]
MLGINFYLLTTKSTFDFLQDTRSVIISILIILSIVVILSVKNKGKQKVDHGFRFSYFRLSYRRKMIRSIWSALIFIPLLVLALWTTHLDLLALFSFTLIFLLLFIIQAFYNYVMWKKHKV